MRTNEEKIDWLKNATTEEVIEQIVRSSKKNGEHCAKYGFFSDKALESSMEIDLCRKELIRRFK